MKKIILYGAAFFLTVCLCVGALLFASYAPQWLIDDNTRQSVDGLIQETAYPVTWDRSYISLLDNYTDALILMQTKAMVNDSKSTILTNPEYIYDGEDPVTALANYVDMVKPEPSSYYTRYWMGFRAVMRWLLVFLDYFQIRRYVGFAFFVLLFAAMSSLARELDSRQAMAFALAVLMIRPQVVCSSLQYMCCFLMGFSAMLAMPRLHRARQWQGLFFLEWGMLTMFFDFYTTPIVTFGLPMLYLCLLRLRDGENLSLRELLGKLLLWLTGYIGMWLSKLVLTELLTDQPGIRSAWASVSVRLGLTGQRQENAEAYSLGKAFERLREAILPDREAVVLFWLGLAVLLVLLAWKWRRGALNSAAAKQGRGILALGLLPIGWFAATAQPIIIHSFFQYRSIVVLYWAAGAYLCLITAKAPLGHRKEKIRE